MKDSKLLEVVLLPFLVVAAFVAVGLFVWALTGT